MGYSWCLSSVSWYVWAFFSYSSNLKCSPHGTQILWFFFVRFSGHALQNLDWLIVLPRILVSVPVFTRSFSEVYIASEYGNLWLHFFKGFAIVVSKCSWLFEVSVKQPLFWSYLIFLTRLTNVLVKAIGLASKTYYCSGWSNISAQNISTLEKQFISKSRPWFSR